MVELTHDECRKIIDYIAWLEEIAENAGYDVSDRYPSEIQKIIDGRY